jgi:hypothetical protein
MRTETNSSDKWTELKARRKLEVELNKKIRELNKVLRKVDAAGYWGSVLVNTATNSSIHPQDFDTKHLISIGEAKVQGEGKAKDGEG